MAVMFKNWVVTLGGIMAGLGTLPMLVTASHVDFPLWWNSVQFPLILVGLVGTILIGVAAKGQDQHSTAAQVGASTAEVVAKTPAQQETARVMVKKADEQVAAKKDVTPDGKA